RLLTLQAVLLIVFAACVAWWVRLEQWWAVAYLRPAVTVTVVFTCYTTLGQLGVAAMPYRCDAALSALDNRLLGFDPSLAVQPYQTPGRVEFFSFVYGAFIPYIYL